MPPLAQLIRTCTAKYNPQAWIQNLPLFIIDGDVVEEKNLARQHFIPKDVGMYKASVLAGRYSNAFGIPIYPSTKYIARYTTRTEGIPFIGIPENLQFSFQNSIVILAVDSANARRTILEHIFNFGPGSLYHSVSKGFSRNIFIVDAGNEDSFGQIKFFTGNFTEGDASTTIPKTLVEEAEVSFIPYDSSYYAGLGGSVAELSCVDLPQSLAINNMMAALLCSVIQNFLLLKPMSYDGIRYSLDGSMVTEWNTPRRWMERTRYIPHDIRDPTHRAVIIGGTASNFSEINTPIVKSIMAYKKAGLRVTESGDLEAVPIPKPVVTPAEVAAPDLEVVKQPKRPRKKTVDAPITTSVEEAVAEDLPNLLDDDPMENIGVTLEVPPPVPPDRIPELMPYTG
jgi:molybdopterin/thiamine biosynthesis adenylyltransferase